MLLWLKAPLNRAILFGLLAVCMLLGINSSERQVMGIIKPGLVDVQFAFNTLKLDQIKAQWTPDQRSFETCLLLADFVLIASYFLALLSFHAAMPSRFTKAGSIAVLVAAGLDLIENINNLFFINMPITSEHWVLISTIISIFKWLALWTSVSFLLAVLFIRNRPVRK